MVCAAQAKVPGFAERLTAACEEFVSLWTRTPFDLPEWGPKVGLWQQRSNARAAARLIDQMGVEIAGLPDDESERHRWRQRLRERLQCFGHERLGWPEGYRRLLFGDAFYESSIAFARQARAFDPSVTLEQLGQALRNVWIGNSLQMLLDRPVTMRPGLFAYSMLYPVTDNWLDDPGVTRDLKRSFNVRFGERLAGLRVHPLSEREAAVDRLVRQIEQDLPREHSPDLYASLLAIHSGQTRSLDQHGGTGLTDAELLRISFEKGGSSVLTDPYPWLGHRNRRRSYSRSGTGSSCNCSTTSRTSKRTLLPPTKLCSRASRAMVRWTTLRRASCISSTKCSRARRAFRARSSATVST